MLAKLPSVEADAVVIDLEDGVAPVEKASARDRLRELAAAGKLDEGPPWSLRINAESTPWHEDDLGLVSELQPPGTILAKAESVETVASLGRLCSSWRGGVGLMIETARGVGDVRALAGAHPSVDRLVYGSADFRLAMGARPDPGREWERPALHEVLLAARMNDCETIDSVYFRFRDDAGLRAEARIARDLGYDGKSCIHPSQVPVIHDVFASTSEEVAWAEAVLEAWKEQDGRGRGVVVLDGEMIEALHVEVAIRVLRRAD
jgi:citrate lyase subunit beta/citryl-CoA lyase